VAPPSTSFLLGHGHGGGWGYVGRGRRGRRRRGRDSMELQARGSGSGAPVRPYRATAGRWAEAAVYGAAGKSGL